MNQFKHIVASDTDSAYFSLTPLLAKMYPNHEQMDRSEKVEILLKFSKVIQKAANANLNNISANLFNIHGKHYFELKQEVIAEAAYWSGKRRYAMYIINKEGLPIEEFDIKGLDLMKSNFPPHFRKFGESVIKNILFGAKPEDINKDIQDFKQTLTKIDYKHLLKPTGLKKLDEYLGEKPAPGQIFSTLKSRTPINTRAAVYYNDIIRFKGLNTKYPEFRIGDKMYYAYLKKNPYQINIIGLNGYNDPEELVELVETYIDRELLFDSVLKNKLENLYTDIKWDFPSLNPNVSKFFNF